MRFVDIIDKKRLGLPLTKEEIDFWISGYVKGEIPDYQVSALCMAIVLNGMEQREISELTLAMMNSGDVMDLSAIEGIKIDIFGLDGATLQILFDAVNGKIEADNEKIDKGELTGDKKTPLENTAEFKI